MVLSNWLYKKTSNYVVHAARWSVSSGIDLSYSTRHAALYCILVILRRRWSEFQFDAISGSLTNASSFNVLIRDQNQMNKEFLPPWFLTPRKTNCSYRQRSAILESAMALCGVSLR